MNGCDRASLERLIDQLEALSARAKKTVKRLRKAAELKPRGNVEEVKRARMLWLP